MIRRSIAQQAAAELVAVLDDLDFAVDAGALIAELVIAPAELACEQEVGGLLARLTGLVAESPLGHPEG